MTASVVLAIQKPADGIGVVSTIEDGRSWEVQLFVVEVQETRNAGARREVLVYKTMRQTPGGGCSSFVRHDSSRDGLFDRPGSPLSGKHQAPLALA